MELKKFFESVCIGLGFAILLVSCAGFQYRYYGLDLSQVGSDHVKHGKLLGPKEEDDIALEICEPMPNVKVPCIVMLYQEFYEFKKDYLQTKERLKKCEKGN